MSGIFPDLLRATVTNVLVLLLLFSLARPKYREWICKLLALAIVLLDVFVNAYFYARDAYTTVVHISMFLMVPVLFLTKPLFREGIMQWCFNVITSMNIFCMAVFLGYFLSHLLPYPQYTDTAIRVLILSFAIFLFKRYLRPLYAQVLEHWRYYFLTGLSLFACYAYVLGFTGGTVQALQRQTVPLTLLSCAMVCAYFSIFWSLRSISREYALREQAVRADTRQQLLCAELYASREFVETARQHRHDLRHHNALLLEYLQSGNIEGAQAYLEQYDSSIASAVLPQYCVHPVANAVLRMWARRCEEAKVTYRVEAEIPGNLPLTAPELDCILCNILENALNAAAGTQRALLAVRSHCSEGSFCLVVENSAPVKPDFKNGLPVSPRPEGGTGMKSVLTILKKHDGMLLCRWSNHTFITQLILPLPVLFESVGPGQYSPRSKDQSTSLRV